MKVIPVCLRQAAYFFVSLSCASFLTIATFAGTTGKIAGTITDQSTGEPVLGANVTIVGTTLGASSDALGQYFILNIPPGSYSVRATFIGYKTVTNPNIRVSVDLTTEVNFGMESTVVEGEEVVVTAERPLVDKFMTATKVSVDEAELDNSLPVSSVSDIIETTSSNFGGYIRGGRKYDSRTLVDGINISDTYFSGGTGTNVNQVYTSTRRSDGRETNIVDVNSRTVQELAVLAGTFAAEYDAASAGIVNITTKDGGSRIAGKFFLRSSLGGLDHAGPNVYNDLSRYETERTNNLASENPANQEKGRLMNFSQATIDEIGYGADPTRDAELTLSGPMTDRGNFFLSGRYVNSHGSLPYEFNRNFIGSLKLNYNLGNTQKLTGNIMIDDGGIIGGWKNRAYSRKFKYFPEGNAQNEKLGMVGYLTWTHTLSAKTFYELRASYTGRTSRFGYSDDNGDGVISRGENGDFLKITTPEQSQKYLGTEGSGVFNGNRTFFTSDPGNEAFFDLAFSGSGRYRFGQPGFFYEELKRNAYQLKGEITSQLSFHHQLKGGVLYRRHDINDFMQRTQVRIIYDPKFPFEEFQYELNPKEYGVYLQDRIEYQGIIINAGLRLDGFDTGAQQFGDFFNVSQQDTLTNGRIVRHQIRDDSVPTEWFLAPRIGISHPISENAAMHYSFGRFFAPPIFSLLYDEYGVFTNPSLPQVRDVSWVPSKSTAYEIGLQWQFTQDYVVGATAYYRDISNYSSTGYSINPVAGQGFGSYTYVTSFGYGDSRGIEINLTKRPTGWLSGRFSYAYSYIKAGANASNISPNKNSFSATADTNIPFDDRFQWNTYSQNVTGGSNALDSGFDREHRFALTFLVSLPYDFQVSGVSTAESGFWYNVVQTTDDPRQRQQDRSPWTAQTDLRVTKGLRFGNTSLRLFAEGRNLFQQQNTLAYDTTDIPSQALWEENQDPTGVLKQPTQSEGILFFDIPRQFFAGVDFSF